MRKYYIFFIFLWCFSFVFLARAEANHGTMSRGEGECTAQENWPNADAICQAGLVCTPPTQEQLIQNPGALATCQAPAVQSVSCTCSPGKPNSFVCAGTTFACDQTYQVCRADSTNPIIETEDTRARGNNKTYRGVVCSDDKAVAQCRCQNPGKNGKNENRIICSRPGGPIGKGSTIGPGEDGNVFCKGDNYCNNEYANYATNPYDYTRRPFSTNSEKGVPVRGVSCKKTSVVNCRCANPGSTSAGGNKIICTPPGGKAGQGATLAPGEDNSASCIDNRVCNNSVGQPTDSGSYDKKPFGGKYDSLAGVECVTKDDGEIPVPTLPPVPPPPCATGKLVNGVCTAFATPFGVINTDAGSFVLRLFAVLLAFSGGLAVLLIMRAGYTIMVSSGNGEQVKKGREQLVAAIVGLLFIIFSFVIIQVIGVDILRLPDLSGGITGNKTPLNGTCTVGSDECAPGLVCNYVGRSGQCQRP